MKKTATVSATKTALRSATVSALAPARISATASGRTLTITDSVSGANIVLTVNAQGGLERSLTGCEKHDKQYGNNLAFQVAYMTANVMNSKLGVAKNLQKIAKGINAIPASNIRNLSNRYRAQVNSEYNLLGTPHQFFHEVTRSI